MKKDEVIAALKTDAAALGASVLGAGIDLQQSRRVLSALDAATTASLPHEGAETAASLAAQVAQAVSQALRQLTVHMDGQAVGSVVAPTVSQIIARKAQTRRYTV